MLLLVPLVLESKRIGKRKTKSRLQVLGRMISVCHSSIQLFRLFVRKIIMSSSNWGI